MVKLKRGAPVRERLFANRVLDGDCWRWPGAKDRDGYGWIKIKKKMVYVHRASYETFIGKIPSGAILDHVRARGCQHRDCFNPLHLEPVSNKENIMRGDTLAAANTKKTRCPSGHPYNKENTYRHSDGRRVCRTCAKLAAREYRAGIKWAN